MNANYYLNSKPNDIDINNSTYPHYNYKNDNTSNDYKDFSRPYLEKKRFQIGLGMDNLEVQLFYIF